MQHLFGNRKKKVDSVTPSGIDALQSEETLKALFQACPGASFSFFSCMFPGQRNPLQVKKDSLPFMAMSFYREDSIEMSHIEVLSTEDNLIVNTKLTKDQVVALYNKTKTQNISPPWYNNR
ncbi:hypothetical protein DPMN_124733 [Dreissena polymorpha]|uniref:Uncharacterized protein n=1 Tax=Dreissena polymorpha TaxID=45954 RepID=A0A9D4GT54_DREPO|nr:hypothetical protein DPMN_124733 [Dreissena polymorpha]